MTTMNGVSVEDIFGCWLSVQVIGQINDEGVST